MHRWTVFLICIWGFSVQFIMIHTDLVHSFWLLCSIASIEYNSKFFLNIFINFSILVNTEDALGFSVFISPLQWKSIHAPPSAHCGIFSRGVPSSVLWVMSIFSSTGSCQFFPKWSSQSTFPPAVWKGPPFVSQLRQDRELSDLVNFAHLGMSYLLIVVLICLRWLVVGLNIFFNGCCLEFNRFCNREEPLYSITR